MASVGNALEGRKLDLTAAKVLKFGLLKMRNMPCVMWREAGVRVSVFCRPPFPCATPKAGRVQEGGWGALWAFYMAR